MRLFLFSYPGDKPVPVLQLSRRQFQTLCRPSRVTITGDSGTTTIPVGAEEIKCDLCGDDPGNVIYLLDGRRAYCAACWQPKACYCEEIQ